MTETQNEQSDAATGGTQWFSAHLHHHAHDRTGVLVDAVGPFLRAHRSAMTAAYVLPHWRQGPHLRLNIKAEPDVWAEELVPAVEQEIGRYLRAHPSGARPSDAVDALPAHQALAEREQEDGPLTPWLADDTVHFAPYRDLSDTLLGDAVAAALVEDFYCESNALFLEMAAAVREGLDSVEGIALTVLLTTAEAVGGMARNVGSFRSHAEGFIAQCVSPDQVRKAFDALSRSRRAAVAARMRQVVGTLDGTADSALPFAAAWARLARDFSERCEPLLTRDILLKSTHSREEALRNPKLSEYNRLGLSSPEYIRRALLNPVFLRYRVVLNFAYLHLTRLGIAPRVRFALCHLSADAIEDVHGISAMEWMRSFVAQHPGPAHAS